jgi:hypothetical protein
MPVPPIPTVIEPDAGTCLNHYKNRVYQAANGMMTRPHMDVVCVIDICQSGNLAHRKKALDEVNQA